MSDVNIPIIKKSNKRTKIKAEHILSSLVLLFW